MSSSDKDKIDALINLAEFHYQKYKDRRDLEWRVHILIWTLIASIGVFLSDGRGDLRSCLNNLAIRQKEG